MSLDPEILGRLVTDARWATVTKLDLDPPTLGSWDPRLVRDTRLLVPVDVQALVVAPDGTEPMVRLPSAVNQLDGRGPDLPPAFTDGTPRPPGVHLHWVPPDALLRGTLGAGPGGTGLALPALPDRWVVLRLLTPVGRDTVAVRGWVLEAERAVRVNLAGWPAAAAEAAPSGSAVAPEELTGTAGGSATWAVTYDSVTDRFGLHDPLDDLVEQAPDGVVGDAATYVVAGWWSQPTLDPLDPAADRGSLDDILRSLGWSAVTPWVDTPSDTRARDRLAELRDLAQLGRRNRFVADPTVAVPPTPPVAAGPVGKLTTTVRTELASAAAATFVATPWWPHATLLHGSVYGVPLGAAAGPDNRPAPDGLRVAVGLHEDDVLGAIAGTAFDPADDQARRDTERLVGAFTGGLLRGLGSPDGAVAVEEHEHAIAYGSLPGGMAGEDRFVTGRSAAPQRVGRGARATSDGPGPFPSGPFLSGLFREKRRLISSTEVEAVVSAADGAAEPATDTEPRVVPRPAPRFHFPLDPLVAVQGAHRSLRSGHDGRGSPDGLLACRWPHQVVAGFRGLLAGQTVLGSLGNGAVPPEVLSLAREAVLHSPYHRRWLSDIAARAGGLPAGPVVRRFDAEAGLRFGTDATYDGTTQVLAAGAPYQVRAGVADQVWRHSLLVGADPSPVGVTLWSQPWVPLWLEWEAELTSTASTAGSVLGAVDLQPDTVAEGSPARYSGRSLLTTGAARTLASAVRDFLAAEDALERTTGGAGEVDDDVEQALAGLAAAVGRLDLLTASLDGLRLQLLGVPAGTGHVRTRADDGSLVPPTPAAPPQFLVAGSLRLTRARLLDTFGRTLDLPGVEAPEVPARLEVPERPGSVQVRPRLTRPARWMFRLVDAAAPAGDAAAEASVDQVDPASAVSPVAGFLLPDHLDESLEVFDAAGDPVGELFHTPIGGRVVWEIAPGRSGPPDAGPLHGLVGGQRPLGRLATGLLAADVGARRAGLEPSESALTAALRAIDTSLWTIDTFAGLGSEHVAGLVGRPVAVVRAQLWLELAPEVALDLRDPDHAAQRRAAETALAAETFPVRLGELTRTDDGLLGFFVDDDYAHLHLVDRVAAQLARPAGPAGHRAEEPSPVTHPYLLTEDTLGVHLGQRITLTLLLYPGGRVHLTSGVLPRKALELARDWVAPGLSRISPSLRTGPVLVDPDTVRLPRPSVFGRDQTFTSRSGPETWRDDPIVAATQTALLPEGTAGVRDGHIRALPGERAR